MADVTAPMEERTSRPDRTSFAALVPMATRWMDNDVYGHVNNVVYYSFFDTAVNGLLIEAGVLEPSRSGTVGLVVETRCTYFESVAFPDRLEIGVRVAHVGRSSVRYDLAVFREGTVLAAARGAFTHVYVDRASQKPVPIPDEVRAVLEKLRV